MNIISNLKPLKTIVRLGNGLVNLVLIPTKEYKKKKDGISTIKAIGDGLSNFKDTTLDEVVNIGYQIANVSDKVIGKIDEAFGPLNFKNKRNYVINSQDGMINAPRHLYNCLSNMKEIVIDIPYQQYNRKGILKAINSLYTNWPNLIIEPIKGITKAVKHTIKTIKYPLESG